MNARCWPNLMARFWPNLDSTKVILGQNLALMLLTLGSQKNKKRLFPAFGLKATSKNWAELGFQNGKIWARASPHSTYIYMYMYMYMYMYIYTHTWAVKLGSGPILGVLKVRFGPI